jgi:ribonuclease HII
MVLTLDREAALGHNEGRRIAGVDEVGRGPLAGPVVACAVVLPPDVAPGLIARLADSKALKAGVREDLDAAIRDAAEVGLGEASVAEIDTWNILNASHMAMARAVAALPAAPDHALVDGNRLPTLACPAEAVVKGDATVASIAAAGIVAKVARDAAMDRLAAAFPGYGWERNRGYGTAEHRAALNSLGPSDHHRRSFKPVQEAVISR